GRIDPSRPRVILRHLRRPCLVKRTLVFQQPSGSDEDADDDHATEQPKAARGGLDPIASDLPRMAVRGRSFLSERPQIIDFAITRVGKARARAASVSVPTTL